MDIDPVLCSAVYWCRMAGADLLLIVLEKALQYTVRQLYNETDFILTKIEVLSMKQCMPSM